MRNNSVRCFLCSESCCKSQKVCVLLATFQPRRAEAEWLQLLEGGVSVCLSVCLKWPMAPAGLSAVGQEDLPGLLCRGASGAPRMEFPFRPDPVPGCYSVTLGEPVEFQKG